MADFAMPQALELEQTRRNAVPAIRYELFHDTTTQNEYRPGELCYIPVETGQAGAFIDTSTTTLEMTIKVRNKNYMTDFINLPRCGWHAIIQEFGIEINNGLHEQNRHYAECVELDMIRTGENKHPFEMCRSNPYKVGEGLAGKTHINFVKPSMVTNLGLPHNVIFAPLKTNTTATTPDIIIDNLLFRTNEFAHESFGRSGSANIFATAANNQTHPIFVNSQANIATTALSNIAGHFTPSSLNTIGYWDDRILKEDVVTSYSPATSFTANAVTNINGGISHGQEEHLTSYYRLVGGPYGQKQLGLQSKIVAHDFELDSTKFLFNTNYGQSVSSSAPTQWPSKQPCDYRTLDKIVQENLSKVNAQNVQNYYAHCHNIPVGIPLDLSHNDSGKTAIWGSGTKEKPYRQEYASVGAETEFHVQLKVYSSLIGVLSKKWFPSLITPQSRMRIRIRFQEPNVLFQTLMDPCRRVPGTSRDFFPYTGIVNSYQWNDESADGATAAYTSYTLKGINDLESCSAIEIASGIHPVMIANYSEGQIFNSQVAMGQFCLPQLRLKQLNNPFLGLSVSEYKNHNIEAASVPLTLEGYNETQQANTVVGSLNHFIHSFDGAAIGVTNTKTAEVVNLLNNYAYQVKQNMDFGFPSRNFGTHVNGLTEDQFMSTHNGQPYNKKLTLRVNDLQQYSFPTDYRNLIENQNLPDAAANATVRIAPPYLTTAGHTFSAARDFQFKGLNWNPFCIPTPQFVPIRNPENKSTTRNITAIDYVSEEELCYGTHLEHSVAQVRRSHSSLYPLNIKDKIASKIDERLTYIVSNVRLVTQLLILPQTAADSIIQAALSGGISIETEAWKEMESILPQHETQKHLINMAAAFCTNIAFLFRPVDILQGDQAYGYNSFSFYNPFTCFRFDLDATMTDVNGTAVTKADDYNYLGGKPIYYNEFVISSRIPFDIQLQLSAELLPRTPIDNVNKLLQYTRWGDQVYSSSDYLNLNPKLQPSYQTQKGMVINTLQDGYYACFTPISALDDQTITCNPFWTPLEISLRKRLRGKRANKDALPFYKPFNGTFHLAWNFEAFMGQNGRMRTGVPIVNNNMFLRFDKAHMVREYSTQLLTIATCDARAVWERGGTFQFFT